MLPNAVAAAGLFFATLAASAVFPQGLVLNIVDTPDPVPAGTDLLYTITVDNTNASEANGVQVTVQLPAGVSFFETEGCLEDPAGSPTCSLGTIQPFEPGEFTILVRVAAEATGALTVQASATTTTPTFPPTPPASETTMVDSRVDLELDFSSEPSSAFQLPGQPLVFTAEIRNNSLARASGVFFQMNRPSSLRFISADSDQRTGNCFATSLLITCRPGALEPGQGTVLQIAFETGAPGPFLVTALAQSNNGDLDPSDNQAALLFRVAAVADVAVQKSADRRAVRAGGTLSYRITATNRGPSRSGRVVLTDALPAGLELVSVEPAAGCRGTREVTCEIEDLAVDQTAEFRLSVRVDPQAAGEIENTVQAAGEAMDPVTDNDRATALVEVRLAGDLNGDGRVDILDVGPLIAEINDGDGQDPGDAAGGSFRGDPFFDVNEDGVIDQQDVADLGRLILTRP